MTEAAYALAPAWLAVRELRYRVTARGRRTRVVTIATTPLDPARYPKRAIAAPYGLRWEIETNFRHLKGTMALKLPSAIRRSSMSSRISGCIR